MKMKFVRNSKTDRRELVIAVQRGETLDEKRAKVLAKDPSILLLNFEYENARMGTMLRYDVEGLWSLRTFLAKRTMGIEELMGLLRATEGVLDLCTEQRLRPENLFFDPEYVFVNAQCCPRFALVPIEDMPFQERNSPLALLKAMSDVARLRFSTPDAEGLSKRLAAYVVEQSGVFSANTFKRFLESEEVALDDSTPTPEARRSVVEGEGKASWATAGAAAPAGAPADGGSFFWNPLMGMLPDEPAAAATSPAPATAPAAPKTTTTTTVAWYFAPTAPAQPAPAPAPAQPAATPQPAAPQPAPAAPAQPAPAPAPAAARTAYLVRASSGEQYSLAQGAQTKLGRGSACDIRLLGNPKLSRVHASVRFDGQSVYVTDLGAANGVWVNGARLAANQTMATSVGQSFRLADEELYVRVV